MAISDISKQTIKDSEIVSGNEIRQGVFNLIREEYPDFNGDSILSMDELNRYRRLYLTRLVEQEHGELARIDLDVMRAIQNNSILSENIDVKKKSRRTRGQKLADQIAAFGGSWTFIIAFFSFLMCWMLLNSFLLGRYAYDTYPYILLNLILSCIAAIQAPIIMMSQNRQEQKDRQRAENDYKVNLKAELEIKLLSEKIDHLLIHQNKKLLEIQEVQIDYLEDLMKKMGSPK